VTSIWPCRRSDAHGRGVTDIVAVSRALPESATLTSGAAAEKSLHPLPPGDPALICSAMIVLIGRWAIIPTWLLLVVLGTPRLAVP
jgi:hypothetical protein